MEKIWDSFIKREELESAPGVIDTARVQALSLNTYLVHIRDMIEMGMTEYPEAVAEHIEDVMTDIFMDYTYTFEGRYPEPDEISDHLNLPENVDARKNLTAICLHANADNWPEIESQIKQMASVADLDKIDWNSEERRVNAEKMRRRFDQDGYIEL